MYVGVHVRRVCVCVWTCTCFRWLSASHLEIIREPLSCNRSLWGEQRQTRKARGKGEEWTFLLQRKETSLYDLVEFIERWQTSLGVLFWGTICYLVMRLTPALSLLYKLFSFIRQNLKRCIVSLNLQSSPTQLKSNPATEWSSTHVYLPASAVIREWKAWRDAALIPPPISLQWGRASLLCLEADAAKGKSFIDDIYQLLYGNRRPGSNQAAHSQTHISVHILNALNQTYNPPKIPNLFTKIYLIPFYCVCIATCTDYTDIDHTVPYSSF